MRQQNSSLKLLAGAFIAVMLCLAMAMPAFAADNKTITFELKDTSGKVVKTVEAYKGDANKYGPDEDAQVRTTYYDNGKAYDLDAGQAVSGTLDGNKTFTYTQYQKNNASDDKTSGSTTGGDVAKSYDVVVRYVDESGKVISTRTITMNGHDHEFYAPMIFSRTENDKTAYYVAKDSNKVVFKWNDKNTLTQDIVYQKLNNTQSAVNWTIYYMDAETGKMLGSATQAVAAGETGTKALNRTMQFGGKTYHLNAFYKSGRISYTYGSGRPISYVYYDPDGYNTSKKSRTITIEYRNIADGAVIRKKQVKVSSYASGETSVDLETKFDADSKSYVLAKGQKTPVSVGYFSPRDTYQVYYRDVNDKANANTIVVFEDVIEDGGVITTTVTNRVTPGTTTAVAYNPTTGASRNLATFGANGRQLAGGQNTNAAADGNNNNNNAVSQNNGNRNGNGNGNDVSEDGVNLQRDRAPQAGGHQTASGFATGIALAAGIAALAVILLLAFFRRNKKRS